MEERYSYGLGKTEMQRCKVCMNENTRLEHTQGWGITICMDFTITGKDKIRS